MKDPRTAGRNRSDHLNPPAIDRLRGAVAYRVDGRPLATGHVLARVMAHTDALEAGRPTVSPAKARGGSLKARPPGTFGLPD